LAKARAPPSPGGNAPFFLGDLGVTRVIFGDFPSFPLKLLNSQNRLNFAKSTEIRKNDWFCTNSVDFRFFCICMKSTEFEENVRFWGKLSHFYVTQSIFQRTVEQFHAKTTEFRENE